MEIFYVTEAAKCCKRLHYRNTAHKCVARYDRHFQIKINDRCLYFYFCGNPSSVCIFQYGPEMVNQLDCFSNFLESCCFWLYELSDLKYCTLKQMF